MNRSRPAMASSIRCMTRVPKRFACMKSTAGVKYALRISIGRALGNTQPARECSPAPGGVNDKPAIFAAASRISRVIRGASCATAINAPGINARLPAEKHSRNRRRFSASARSSIAQETSAGLGFAGGTRVDFYIDVDGREQRRVTGNRTNPVVTGGAETHLGFRCDGFSVNRRADIRIELYLAWSSIKNPPDPHTFYASSDLAISGTVSATGFWKSIIRDRDP